MSVKRDQYEFVAWCAERGITANDADKLMSCARQLHRLDEKSCNGFTNWKGDWDEEAETRNDAKTEKVETKVRSILKQYGMTPEFNGDPRGGSVYIHVGEVKPAEHGVYVPCR